MDEVYTPAVVSRLLANYWYIRSYLVGVAPKANADVIVTPTTKKVVVAKDVPLGYTPSQSWPFRERRRAQRVRDGKQRGRWQEEWHVSVLDIEVVLNRLSDDDLLLVHLHFFQGYTQEEVAVLLGLANQQTAGRRIERVVHRIARELNQGT